ncbi:hypothetical protein WJ972_08920 [Achromobacter insuavis]
MNKSFHMMPNGRFINGTPRRCPDGTYVGDGGYITRARRTAPTWPARRSARPTVATSAAAARCAWRPTAPSSCSPRMAPDGTYL